MLNNLLIFKAFPEISTGIFNFEPKRARQLAVRTVSDWLINNPPLQRSLQHVVFVPYRQGTDADEINRKEEYYDAAFNQVY